MWEYEVRINSYGIFRTCLLYTSGAQGGKGKDLTHYFNKDGLGAIVNSSRGIIAAYKQEKYAQFGAENFADASRQAVIDMIEDLSLIHI